MRSGISVLLLSLTSKFRAICGFSVDSSKPTLFRTYISFYISEHPGGQKLGDGVYLSVALVVLLMMLVDAGVTYRWSSWRWC
jgi:hypothetical protein